MLNTGTVTLTPYSPINSEIVSKATIFIAENLEISFFDLTKFNILSDLTLKPEISALSENVTSEDKNAIEHNDNHVFTIIKTNFVMENIIVTCKFSFLIIIGDNDESTAGMTLLYPINLQHRTVSVTNWEFQKLGGFILKSSHPLSITAINIYWDFDYLQAGWIIEGPCNYPEANLLNEIYFQNHTLISGEQRK
jgi:hypothetical protein